MIIGIFAVAVMGLSAFGVQKSLSSNAEVSQLTKENIEALAEVSEDCPNGCLDSGDGCNCNGYHPHYLEANKSNLSDLGIDVK